MKSFIHILLFGILLIFVSESANADSRIDDSLTEQIAAVLKRYEMVRPGMTRRELSKAFTTEGGLSTSTHRTYIYRGCPYIKVDVYFTLSDPKQANERSTDIIAKISKPYLEWSIND
jgi:hypothetical protein